jgi:hypothetical protein
MSVVGQSKREKEVEKGGRAKCCVTWSDYPAIYCLHLSRTVDSLNSSVELHYFSTIVTLTHSCNLIPGKYIRNDLIRSRSPLCTVVNVIHRPARARSRLTHICSFRSDKRCHPENGTQRYAPRKCDTKDQRRQFHL